MMTGQVCERTLNTPSTLIEYVILKSNVHVFVFLYERVCLRKDPRMRLCHSCVQQYILIEDSHHQVAEQSVAHVSKLTYLFTIY